MFDKAKGRNLYEMCDLGCEMSGPLPIYLLFHQSHLSHHFGLFDNHWGFVFLPAVNGADVESLLSHTTKQFQSIL